MRHLKTDYSLAGGALVGGGAALLHKAFKKKNYSPLKRGTPDENESTVLHGQADSGSVSTQSTLSDPRLSNAVFAITGAKELYLLEMDSIGNIVALQTDSINPVIPAAFASNRDGNVMLLGSSGDSLSKATMVKIDPLSCLPLLAPVFPSVASMIQDQKLMAYKETIHHAEKELANTLEAFPNPFSEIVTCRHTVKKTGRMILRLTHIDGRTDVILKDEMAAPGVYNLLINTSGYPTGAYILSLMQGNSRQMVKIVKLQ